MHSLGVCHRDLKLDNCILTGDTVKVGDFGLATQFKTEGEQYVIESTSKCGSPPYMAPELFTGKAYNGSLVDVCPLDRIIVCVDKVDGKLDLGPIGF